MLTIALGYATMEIVRYIWRWPGPITSETSLGLSLIVVLSFFLVKRDFRRLHALAAELRDIYARSVQ